MQLTSQEKTALQKEAFKEIDLTLERQALARQEIIPLAIVTRKKVKKIVSGKKEVKTEIKEVKTEVKKIEKIKVSDLMKCYTKKADRLRYIGFNDSIESKQLNIQDAMQEAIIGLYLKYEVNSITLDEPAEHLIKKATYNATVNKWRSKDSDKRYTELTNVKGEFDDLLLNGTPYMQDFLSEYKNTLTRIYYVLSGKKLFEDTKKRKIEKLKKKNGIHLQKSLFELDKIKFKKSAKNQELINIFNWYHVKQFTQIQIAEKINHNQSIVQKRIASINRKLMQAGIKELFEMRYILTEYMEPKYTYLDKPPKEFKPFKNQLTGKTVYALEPYETDINMTEYKEQDRISTQYHEKVLDLQGNYSFTKKAFLIKKIPVSAMAHVRQKAPTFKNRFYVASYNLDGSIHSQSIARFDSDIVHNDLIGYQDKKVFDTIGININDGLSKSCDTCGYAIDHCRCQENADFEYLETLNV